MKKANTIVLPKEVTCPECKATHDMATNMNPDDFDNPVAGDLVLCWDCQTINIYTEELELRSLTEAELMELSLTELGQYQSMITEAKAAMLEDKHE